MSPSSTNEYMPVRRSSSRSQRQCLQIANAMIVQPLSQRPRTSSVRNPKNSLRQIYGAKCEITLLGEESYYSCSSRPFSTRFISSSTTTSSGPYGGDILYGGDVEKSGAECRLGQSSLVDLDRVKDGRRDREHKKQMLSRDSLSQLPEGKDKEDRSNGSLLQSSHPKVNQFKPNGLRNSLVTKGRSSQDDIVAMGTIWSPNVQPKPLRTFSVCTSSNVSSSAVGAPRRVSSVGVTSGSYKHVLSLPNAHQTSKSLNNSLDSKYSDPLVGAPTQFQQRLAELSTLEADTVRYEKTRKLKKKPVKQDRDS